MAPADLDNPIRAAPFAHAQNLIRELLGHSHGIGGRLR